MKHNFKHGHTGGGSSTPTYIAWSNMRDRCLNPKIKSFGRYGGLGITVCERWNSYTNFLSDMGERPEGKSIDRINTRGNYEPSNCRWATLYEQARNKRSTRMLTHRGKTMCASDWATAVGLGYTTLRKRLKDGWPVGAALDTPAFGGRP